MVIRLFPSAVKKQEATGIVPDPTLYCLLTASMDCLVSVISWESLRRNARSREVCLHDAFPVAIAQNINATAAPIKTMVSQPKMLETGPLTLFLTIRRLLQ